MSFSKWNTRWPTRPPDLDANDLPPATCLDDHLGNAVADGMHDAGRADLGNGAILDLVACAAGEIDDVARRRLALDQQREGRLWADEPNHHRIDGDGDKRILGAQEHVSATSKRSVRRATVRCGITRFQAGGRAW